MFSNNSKPSPEISEKTFKQIEFKFETEVKTKIAQQKKFSANNGIKIKVNVGCGIYQNLNYVYTTYFSSGALLCIINC